MNSNISLRFHPSWWQSLNIHFQEYEQGKDIETGSVGKRPKAEQAEHKRKLIFELLQYNSFLDSDGDQTRKIVDNAMHGEAKRKAENLKK